VKHTNRHYQFPVVTSQETDLLLNFLTAIETTPDQVTACYSMQPDLKFDYVPNRANKRDQQVLLF